MSVLYTYFRRCLSICAVLFALCGCHEMLQPQEEGTASLKLVLNAPTYGLELKSVSSDPDSPENWTQWERAVDGRYIYRVTAFILDGDRLVAHEDIKLDGEVTETEVDFEANFTHGTYTLMVVANYSAHEAPDGSNGTRKYAGIQDFTETVEDILGHTVIDNFTNLYSDSFIKYELKSTDGVCPCVPQPLTLTKTIELHPGVNQISGELKRSYSRVRISVENNSDEDLKVSSMRFNDIFTQSSAYIFDGKGYINNKVAIDVASTDALTSFTGTETAPMTIPAKQISVVFDAYILESQRNSTNEKYSYSLGLRYGNQTSYILNNTTSITKAANVNSGHYIIVTRNNKRYLKAGTNTVTSQADALGTLKAGMSIPKEYVWTFDNKKSDNTSLSAKQFYIGTADAMNSGQTSYYIANPESNKVALGSNKSVYFTVGEKDKYLTFESSAGGSWKYLYNNNGSITGYGSNGSNAQFYLYQVDAPSGSVTDIPLNTINDITGQPEEVNEIKRNDFINALVKVSYSKNQGHFIYEVRDWGTAGGDVSFN